MFSGKSHSEIRNLDANRIFVEIPESLAYTQVTSYRKLIPIPSLCQFSKNSHKSSSPEGLFIAALSFTSGAACQLAVVHNGFHFSAFPPAYLFQA
jgi:hypothetical protein